MLVKATQLPKQYLLKLFYNLLLRVKTIMNNNIPNYNISNHSYVKLKTSKHSNYDDIRRLNSKPCRVAGTKMWRDETG